MARPALRQDIATAVRRSGATLGCKRELRVLVNCLTAGEKVRRVAAGRYNQRSGLLVLTGRRLLFIAEGWFRKSHTDFPIVRISQVAWQCAYGSGDLVLNIGGLREEIGLDASVGERIARELRGALARVDEQRAVAMDREAALYAMVEDLHAVHFAPAAEIVTGDMDRDAHLTPA